MSVFEDDWTDTAAEAADVAGSMDDELQFAMSDDESPNNLAASMHSIDIDDIKDPQSKINHLLNKLAKANSQIEKKNEALVLLEAARDESTKETKRLNGEIDRLTEELEVEQENACSNEENIANSVRSNNSFMGSLDRLKQELDEERVQSESKEQTIARLGVQLKEAEEGFAKDAEGMNGKIGDLEQKLKLEQEKTKELRDENKDLRTKRSDLEKEVHAAGLQRENDMEDLKQLRTQLKSRNNELKDSRKHEEELEEAMRATIDEFDQRQAQASHSIDDYKRKLEACRNDLKQMASQFQSLKNDRQKQLPDSLHASANVQQSAAQDSPISSHFDDDNNSRASSRNYGLFQSMTLEDELGDGLASESDEYEHVEHQEDSDPEVDVRSDDSGDNASLLNRSISTASDLPLELHESNLSTGSLVHDRRRIMTSDGNMSNLEDAQTGTSNDESALLADSTSRHEETPVDHPRQPFGIPSTSRRFWADEDTAPYAPRFDHSVYQKRETFERGTQTEDIPRNPDPGFNEEDRERLISTLHPLLYLLYMLTILLGGMINRLIRLEVTLRKQFNLPTDVEYIKTSPRDQIHGAMATSPSQQDDTAQHRSEETMTTSVREAEGYLKRLVRYVLLWSYILGVLMVRLVYVWCSDDEWQWTAANKTPRCIPIELLRGHRNEHDWVQVRNFQVVKILNDRVAG